MSANDNIFSATTTPVTTYPGGSDLGRTYPGGPDPGDTNPGGTNLVPVGTDPGDTDPHDTTGIGRRNVTHAQYGGTGFGVNDIIRLRGCKVRLDILSPFNPAIKESLIILRYGCQHLEAVLYNNDGDGNCLFRAVSVCETGNELQHVALRLMTFEYMMEGFTTYRALREVVQLGGCVTGDVVDAMAKMKRVNVFLYLSEERVWWIFRGNSTATDDENLFVAANISRTESSNGENIVIRHVYSVLFTPGVIVSMVNVSNVREYTSESQVMQFKYLDRSCQRSLAKTMFDSLLDQQNKIFHVSKDVIENSSVRNLFSRENRQLFVQYLQQQDLKNLSQIVKTVLMLNLRLRNSDVYYDRLHRVGYQMYEYFHEIENSHCILDQIIKKITNNSIFTSIDWEVYYGFIKNIDMSLSERGDGPSGPRHLRTNNTLSTASL